MTQPSATSPTGAHLVPMTSSSIELDISLQTSPCLHSDDPAELTHCHEHPAIVQYVAEIRTRHEHKRVGRIKLLVLSKVQMEVVSPGEMERQARVYDEIHLGGKIGKVENYLANENFLEEYQGVVDTAEYIYYVEEIVLEQSARGHGIGLAALSGAIASLRMPLARTVLLLEAGAIGPACSHEEAAEKLSKHWGKLGFRAWSYTDTAWLCVRLEDFTRRPPAAAGLNDPRTHSGSVLESPDGGDGP